MAPCRVIPSPALAEHLKQLSSESPDGKPINDWSIRYDIMATVTAFQAKTRFGELLDRVVRGEEIVITRHGKAVGRLVPASSANLEHTRQAVAELRAGRSLTVNRRGFKPLTDRDIKDSVEQGRS